MSPPRKRKNFSKATIANRFRFCGGRCEWRDPVTGVRCDAVLKPGAYEADHANPDGLTGLPTFDNCRILCRYHHRLKTEKDRIDIDRAKRREIVDTGADRVVKRGMMTRKLKSRGFAIVAKPPLNGFAKIAKQDLPRLPPRSIYEDC